MEANNNILVFVELSGGTIAGNSLELLGEATRLKAAQHVDSQVVAAILGNDVEQHAATLWGYGADSVVVCEDAKLSEYRPDYYGEALSQLIKSYKPAIVLIGATALGAELAPTVAAKLKTGLAAHCTSLRIDDKGRFVQVVPAFGGKVLGDIYTPEHRPQMASIKTGITQKIDYQAHTGKLEHFRCDLHGFGDRITVQSVTELKSTCKPLCESECIIGGGFGIGTKDDWHYLDELATLLNGATACTRPALDEGWTDNEQSMIGTSGVAVAPKLYITIGVSGAAHHTCGVKDTGTIISINKDENAPIFGCSDFKVVADWRKIVPVLIDKLRK